MAAGAFEPVECGDLAVSGKPIPVSQRFWSKVDRRGPDECWMWLADLDSHGYGRIRGDQRQVRPAHRVAWELANGEPWPNGKISRHSCDTPACVNPRHISPGTFAENTRDMMERGRHYMEQWPAGACGHPWSIDKRGRRFCATCRTGRRRAWMAANAEHNRTYQREWARKRAAKRLAFLDRVGSA
jgi:hypothetical protein